MNRCAVVLSPHLDDALLSCPGWILERSRNGCIPVVAVPFSERGHGNKEMHCAESAMATLGALVRSGGFAHAAARGALFNSYSKQLCQPMDLDTVGHVMAWFHALIDELTPSEVLAPLGVDQHVDHRISHQIAMDLIDKYPRISFSFFEERPAVYVQEAIWLRLAHLNMASHEFESLSMTVRCERFFQSYFGHPATRLQVRPGDPSPIVVHWLEVFARGTQSPMATIHGICSSWPLDLLSDWLVALDSLPSTSCGFIGSPLYVQWAAVEYAKQLGFLGSYVERSWKLG